VTRPAQLAGPDQETVGRAVAEATAALRAAGVESPRLEAELLLAGTLGIERSALRLAPDRALLPKERATYDAGIARRSQREPIQYILGRASFRTLELEVDRRVLIPRPETELLAGAVLEWSERSGRHGSDADIGTGSGAIALSLAVEGRFAAIVATDVSPDALAVARSNAKRLGLGERVEFRAGSLFEALAVGPTLDVIVSNPPYVAEAERAGLMPEVRDWEPAVALFAGDHGLRVLYELIDGAFPWLREGGLLALEIGHGQVEPAGRHAAERGYDAIRVLRDLAGRERIILAERGGIVVRGTNG
jgi:release factor glutamine methyltransferase